MKRKKRVGIAFLSLFAIALCAVVAYGLVDLKLNKVMSNATVKDKWCMKIDDVSEANLSEGSSSSEINYEKTNISFKADLASRDDSVSYQFKVKNCGTNDAYYFNDSINNSDNIEYKIDGIKKGDIVKPKQTKKITLSVVNISDAKVSGDYQVNLDFTPVN